MSIELEIQKAVYLALSSDSVLNDLLACGCSKNGVYDHHPQPVDNADDSVFPYLTIGEDVFADFSTDTSIGVSGQVIIHAWSRAHGFSEMKSIQGRVKKILNRADLQVRDAHVITIDFDSSESFKDSDGKTRHGVSAFRILAVES